MCECAQNRVRRLVRREIAEVGTGYARGRRSPRFNRRVGWFAHRGGVSRCGQVYRPAKPSVDSTWRGDE